MLLIQQAANKIPTPVAGLALGVVSTGKLLELYGYQQSISIVLATVLVTMVLFKFAFNPAVLLADLRNPVLGSIVPTAAMTLMVLSSHMHGALAGYSLHIWYLAVGLHVLLMIAFFIIQIIQFKAINMLPSWFIPPVGLAVAALTCPGGESVSVAQYLLYFAIGMYFLLLPIMLFRLILLPIVDVTKPTIAILAAPPNLCLAAYLSFMNAPSLGLVLILMGIGLLMTSLVYLAMFVLVRLPFSPAFAGYTFPLVISATASIKLCEFLERQSIDMQLVNGLQSIATVQLYIACAMVSYVCVRYAAYYKVFAPFTHVRGLIK